MVLGLGRRRRQGASDGVDDGAAESSLRRDVDACLSDAERLVLQIVRAGTTETAAIVETAKIRFGRTTVFGALERLTSEYELLRKTADGGYELGKVVDPYALAWVQAFAARNGWGAGSRLTNRQVGSSTTEYEVELVPGRQTVGELMGRRREVASALGLPVHQVIVGRTEDKQDVCRGRLTIIEGNPVAEVRYFAGARFVDGVIKGVGRLADGSREADVTVWDDRGMVPTALTGPTGNGKTTAAKVLACGALSSGVLNLFFVDPQGFSCPALARRARVAIVGKENVDKAAELVSALVESRLKLAADAEVEQLWPSTDLPGWMLLHEAYGRVRDEHRTVRRWEETLGAAPTLGIWPVAVNESLSVAVWGNDRVREGWTEQTIAFGGQAFERTLLDAGMYCNPADLPRDDRGRWTPGMAVHRWLDTPVQWDWLPSDAIAREIAQRGGRPPAMTAEQAFETFFNAPEVPWRDVEVLESFLGKAVDGRWHVGGPGATHRF